MIHNDKILSIMKYIFTRMHIILILLITVIIICYAAVGIVVRPTMFSDSGWGFTILDSMKRGAEFNYALTPDPKNISSDTASFMTTWSPGQYLVPGFIEHLGLSLGVAIALTTAVFSLLGLIGWYLLYIAFGFPRETAAITCMIIVSSRFFALSFGIYTGGEVLLFGTAPWFMLAVWRSRDLRWSDTPMLLVGMFILFLAKLSGVPLSFAILAGVILSPQEGWSDKETIRRLVIAAVTIGVFSALFYFAWLAHGWTAASGGGQIRWSGLIPFLAFAMTSVWAASLSLGDLASFIFLHPSRPLLPTLEWVNLALLPFAFITFALVWKRLKNDHADYRLFVLTVAGTYIAILGIIIMRGGSISFEERHFRPISLLLLIGVVHVVIQSQKSLFSGLLTIAATGFALYGIMSFIGHARANMRLPLGVRGVRHAIATTAVLDYLNTIEHSSLDGQRPVVLVPSPEITIELQNTRSFANHADFENIDDLCRRSYLGRVPRIYVLVQMRLIESGKAWCILKSFTDYPSDKWREVKLGEFVVFEQ